jgi:glycosyltransferase involved in cell wall biosynthesis
MKNFLPEASVLMPVHRVDTFLGQSIQSILNQSFTNYELILILNGLGDEEINYIKTIYNDYRILVITTNFTKIFHCLNLGLDIAKSNYIIRMDSDDVASPNRLEEQIKFMNSNLNIGISGTFYNLIDENSAIVKSRVNKKITQDSDIKKLLRFKTTIAHPTVIARKAVLLSCSGYCNVDYIEDWDLWLRAARKNIIFSILPIDLLSYRVHSKQITSLEYKKDKLFTVLSLLSREFIFTGNFNFLISIFYNTFLYIGVKAKKICRRV